MRGCAERERRSSRRVGDAGRALVFMTSTLVLVGCEIGGQPTLQSIAGPSVVSPTPTQAPYVWEGERGLEIWAKNSVTRGSVTLVGSGDTAFIRVDPASGEFVLRGPDLDPPARGVRGVRIRCRWVPDPSLQPGAALALSLVAHFERAPTDPEQPTAYAMINPTPEWTDVHLDGAFSDLTAVRYAYLHSWGGNRGAFDIARIELR